MGAPDVSLEPPLVDGEQRVGVGQRPDGLARVADLALDPPAGALRRVKQHARLLQLAHQDVGCKEKKRSSLEGHNSGRRQFIHFIHCTLPFYSETNLWEEVVANIPRRVCAPSQIGSGLLRELVKESNFSGEFHPSIHRHQRLRPDGRPPFIRLNSKFAIAGEK